VNSRDQWHAFRNAGDEPLRFLEIVAPGTFAGYFRKSPASCPTANRTRRPSNAPLRSTLGTGSRRTRPASPN